MTKPINHPGELKDLLQASPEKLREWAGNTVLLEFEELEQVQNEQNLVKALLEDTHVQEDAEKARVTKGWIHQMFQFFQFSKLAYLTLFIVAAGATGFGAQLFFEKPKPRLYCKSVGRCLPPSTQRRLVVVHSGVWDPKARAFQRKGSGDRVFVHQSLLFGFTLHEPGYIYLFVLPPKGKVELLYPDPSVPATIWKKGYSDFKIKGVRQQYTFDGQLGAFTFAVIQSAKPLTKMQLQQLYKRHRFSSRLKSQYRDKQTISYDLFVVHVEKK